MLSCLGLGWPQVLGNASFHQAVMNILNILTGVGLLSIPFALRQAGWAGLGILWLLGFVTNYTGGLAWCRNNSEHPAGILPGRMHASPTRAPSIQ